MPAAPAPAGISAPAAVMLGFLAIAIETEIVEAILLPASRGRRAMRALHFVLAALQLLGVGVLVATGVAAHQRFARRFAGVRGSGPVAGLIFLVVLAISLPTLWEDLGGAARKISAGAATVVLLGLIVAVSLAEAAALALFAWMSRRFANLFVKRALAAIVALSLGALGSNVLPHDYPGIHLSIVLVAGSLLAIALHGVRLSLPRLPRPALVLAGSALVATLVAPFPNAVVADMLLATGSVVAPFSSRLRGVGTATASIAPGARAWFTSRARLPSIPPRGARLLPPDGVVLLLTVDALRADVIMSGKHDKQLPSFAALRERGVRFTRARSPGAQTVPVITGLFTGKYYTQLRWAGGTAGHAWPTEDNSVGFPEILGEAGVTTVTLPTLQEVTSQHGTVRGFVEDRAQMRRPPGEPSPLASTVAERILVRLERAEREGGPLFLYVHFADAHAPYDRGGADGSVFDCYLRELALVDEAIGSITAALDRPAFAKRSVIIVSSDHGEAFGEHGQRYHANTLYDELLRVPLLIQGSMFPAHAVDVPATLLDLGPTILELYGQPTPAAFMGQSLVRLLRGEPDQLTRPIAADSGRHLQALVFADNFKIIRNYRNNTVELYNLDEDPGEERNIYDSAPDALQRLATIQLLFRANAYRRKGYAPPFRK